MRPMRYATAAAVALLPWSAAGCASQMKTSDQATGVARIECAVTASGRPADCRGLSEDPPGMGFGAAALEIIQRGRLSARTRKGAEGSRFVVQVPFRLAPVTREPQGEAQTPVEGRPDRP